MVEYKKLDIACDMSKYALSHAFLDGLSKYDCAYCVLKIEIADFSRYYHALEAIRELANDMQIFDNAYIEVNPNSKNIDEWVLTIAQKNQKGETIKSTSVGSEGA